MNNSDNENILICDNVSKYYSLGSSTIEALKNVTLSIKKAEFIAIAGPSGSGKSTLLHILAGLDKPSTGSVKLLDYDIHKLDDDRLSKMRNKHIGFIFQTFNLIPVLNVYENIEYPCLIYSKDRKNKERIFLLLEEIKMLDKIKKRPNQLSGGERQRVAIARALINSPSIVFADEPTANLDHKTGDIIMNIMKSMNEKYSTTFVFSTHDPTIMKNAERIIHLQDGKLIKDQS
ncbi:MAG: ABC transporter ATP-binding protein [Spirochaetales bacterium]|nr:ABC transporter ATP-binding protein [Spirochaetales bacterium]